MLVHVLVAFVALTRLDVVQADACEDCVSTNKQWCASSNKCNDKNCSLVIKRALNCPKLPDPANAYNDTLARTKWATLFAAANLARPQRCLNNQWPTMTTSKVISTECTVKGNGPNTTCYMFTAFDATQKILVMSFRGTSSLTQLEEEFFDFSRHKKPFFDSGYVFEFFYEGFESLWNAGLMTEMKNLKYKYPDYELWVTGHSLGAALASVGASYVVKTGLFDPAKVKLLTIGQPRTGDYDYALWQSNTFAYSYRVVHHKDVIVHLPPQLMPDGDEMYHHRTEIWYNNDMKPGDPYTVCQEADGPYCSDTQVDLSIEDHLVYYNRDVPAWGALGCP